MNLEIRDLQMLQLEIAKEVKRICEINQIDYFLAGGTLLGAVRHQGFIPWDDDIDIGMKLTEYKKFLVCCKDQLDERFELQTWDLDLSYGMPFAKIRLCNTTMEEKFSRRSSYTMEFGWIFFHILVHQPTKPQNSK